MYTTGRYRFRYRKKDGYDTTAIRHNGDVHAVRAEVGLFGRIAEGDWKAKAYLYNSQRGYPSSERSRVSSAMRIGNGITTSCFKAH